MQQAMQSKINTRTQWSNNNNNNKYYFSENTQSNNNNINANVNANLNVNQSNKDKQQQMVLNEIQHELEHGFETRWQMLKKVKKQHAVQEMEINEQQELLNLQNMQNHVQPMTTKQSLMHANEQKQKNLQDQIKEFIEKRKQEELVAEKELFQGMEMERKEVFHSKGGGGQPKLGKRQLQSQQKRAQAQAQNMELLVAQGGKQAGYSTSKAYHQLNSLENQDQNQNIDIESMCTTTNNNQQMQMQMQQPEIEEDLEKMQLNELSDNLLKRLYVDRYPQNKRYHVLPNQVKQSLQTELERQQINSGQHLNNLHTIEESAVWKPNYHYEVDQLQLQEVENTEENSNINANVNVSMKKGKRKYKPMQYINALDSIELNEYENAIVCLKADIAENLQRGELNRADFCHKRYMRALVHLADIYAETKDELSLQLFLKAQYNVYSTILLDEMRHRANIGAIADASEDGIDQNQDQNQNLGFAKIYKRFGQQKYYWGEYEEAMKCHQKSIEYYSEVKDEKVKKIGIFQNIYGIGICQQNLNLFEQATQTFNQAYNYGDDYRLRLSLGDALYQEDDEMGAYKMYSLGYQVSKRMNGFVYGPNVLFLRKMADIQFENKKYDEARELYEKAEQVIIKLKKEISDIENYKPDEYENNQQDDNELDPHSNENHIQQNVADVMPKQCIPEYKQNLRLAQQIIQKKLCWVYHKLSNKKKAVDNSVQYASDVAKMYGENSSSYGEAIMMEGMMKQQVNYLGAIQNLQQALDIFVNNNDKQLAAECHTELAKAQIEILGFTKAEKHLLEALRLNTELFGPLDKRTIQSREYVKQFAEQIKHLNYK